MKPVTIVASLLIAVLFSTGCSRKPAPTAAPPPEVLVTTVTPHDVPRVLERVATLDGFINANINAQVQGYIVSRDYQEGSVVKKGDLLFTIDPRPFQAVLDQAKAQAALDQVTLKRQEDLRARKVIAQQEYDIAVANAQKSQGAAEAAQVNLDFCSIVPVS